MKKSLLLAASCLMLFACKKETKQKDNETEAEKPKYAVNVNLTGFEQTVTPIADAKATLSGKTTTATTLPYTRLVWVVYDADGNQVSRLEQNTIDPAKIYRVGEGKKWAIKTNATLGAISDSLSAGTYTLVAIATGREASLNVEAPYNYMTSNWDDTYVSAKLSAAKFYPGKFGSDAFYYKGSLTVAATNATKSITLNRIVGQIVVATEDKVPSNIGLIEFHYDNDMEYFNLIDNKPASLIPRYLGAGSLQYTVNSLFTFSRFAYNTVSPMTVRLIVHDNTDAGTILYTKTINNVLIYPNKKTTLSGKLFTNEPSSFAITVNDAWDTGNTIKF